MRVKSYNIGIDWEGVKITSGILVVLVVLSLIGAAGYSIFGEPFGHYDEETDEFRDVEPVPVTNWDPIHWAALPLLGIFYGFGAVAALLLAGLIVLIVMFPLALMIDIQKEGTESNHE